jgi:hypothetical protein
MNKYTKNMFKLKFRISFVKKKKKVFVIGWWLDWFQLSTRDLVKLIIGAPDVNVF